MKRTLILLLLTSGCTYPDGAVNPSCVMNCEDVDTEVRDNTAPVTLSETVETDFGKEDEE